jgi:hypothetical protein
VTVRTAQAAVFLLAGALALGGCAAGGPTEYGPKFGAFGYSDDARPDGAVRVRFTGNSETPRGTVEGFALYRAAEITLAAGFAEFAIMERTFHHRIDKPVERTRAPRIILRESSRQYDATLDAGRRDARTRIRRDWMTTTLVIRPYRGTPPQGALRLEHAGAVIKRLAPLVKGGK